MFFFIVTLSDRSSTSSPSETNTNLYLTNNNTTNRQYINKSGTINYFYTKDKINAVINNDSISNAIDACSDVGIINYSLPSASVTSSKCHHKRQKSNESGKYYLFGFINFF